MDRVTSTMPPGLKILQLNDQKAGMQGLDKETINKVIYEASKGTPYFAFQEKRQKSIDGKVAELRALLARVTMQEKKTSLQKMNSVAESLELCRDLSHSIVHIDMDAFYAAVEEADNPSVKGKPMAVGSMSMLSTSNYEARKYGVRAAMPGFIAKKLCPQLTVVPCNFDKYRKVSGKVRAVIEKYDPDYCAASLDEMYLDLTNYIQCRYAEKLTGEDGADCHLSHEERDQMAYDIVNEIRSQICSSTGLTASAGIAPNVMLAKVCSDQNKPNGQYQIASTLEAVQSFVSSLPVKKISGIGPVQGQVFNAIGIHTCSDLWEHRDVLPVLFKPSSVDFYLRVSIGIGSTTVKSDHVRKSIGTEQTFKEISCHDELHKKCRELCDEAVEDLQLHQMVGKVVVLKYKTVNFETHTRNQTLSCFSSDNEVIYKAAKRLLDSEIASAAPNPLRLRLMGIRLANLVPEESVPSDQKHLLKISDFLKAGVKTGQKNRTETGESVYVDHCSSDSNIQTSEKNSDTKTPISTSPDCKEDALAVNSCKETPAYLCPVCQVVPKVNSVHEFNSHLDQCLNRSAIKEILAVDLLERKRKYPSSENQHTKKAKRVTGEKKISDYFS